MEKSTFKTLTFLELALNLYLCSSKLLAMIYKFDPRYTIAQFFVSIALRLNFRKMVFVGKKENFSPKRPVILAPNHRNALLDALLFVYSGYWSKQVVFLARADIFKKKFIAWILRGMRILPVYRVRDGKDNLDKNTEIFENCGRILKRNNPIALFPEAAHNAKQALLPIKKAVPRIALPTEAQFDFALNSQIVPVAIYYNDMHDFLSDVYVRYGKPIEVSKYKDEYAENPTAATNHLRDELENELKKIVVNIWNDEFYDDYQFIIDTNAKRIAKEKFAQHKDAFALAARYIVLQLDHLFEHKKDDFDTFIAKVREARSILTANKLSSKDSFQQPTSKGSLFACFVALVLSAPVAIFGLLNGIFPILINRKLCGMFKDKQFVPSVRYVIGLFFVPLFTLLQSFLLGLFTNCTIAIGYLIAVPITFYVGLWWRKWYYRTKRGWIVNRFAKNQAEVYQKVKELVYFDGAQSV